jgi:hypothetical protein
MDFEQRCTTIWQVTAVSAKWSMASTVAYHILGCAVVWCMLHRRLRIDFEVVLKCNTCGFIPDVTIEQCFGLKCEPHVPERTRSATRWFSTRTNVAAD